MHGYSYGLDRGHVPMREEANLAPMQSSVTLKGDLKQYISELKQLKELVEEINSMEIGIEIIKE